MSIRKRGKAWVIDVQVEGERIRQTVRGARADALKEEARLRRQVANGTAVKHGIEEGLHKYLTEYAVHNKDYKGALSKARAIRSCIAGKSFDDITTVASAIKKARNKPATINRRLALLRRICNLAFKEWGWLETPVAQRVSLIPEHNQRHIYLTVEQVEQLAAHCGPGQSDAIRLAAYTGLRRSELLQLTQENVVNGNLVLGIENKAGRPRLVPVHPAIKDILERIPLRTTDITLRRQWCAARVKAGLPGVRFHDLRHTWASWLAQADVALNVIGELLGHSQPQTTKRYTHLRTEDLTRAVNKIK